METKTGPKKTDTKKKIASQKNKQSDLPAYISVVVPVFNEQGSLDLFFSRLIGVMDRYGKPFEIVFVNDGSTDRTEEMLKELFNARPENVRVVNFNSNYGQYVAILAGFQHVNGEVIVTLDADLQNPPEEIPRLLELIEKGHDLVGSYRRERHDSAFRTYASKLVNLTREKITGLKMKDHGCMLRAYRRFIIEEVIKTQEASTFITALAQKFAGNPIDIPVDHDDRSHGDSKYSLYKLIRITFDLMTGFSLVPLQMFTLFGIFTSGLSGLLVFYMILRRIFVGPEVEGVFTLFAILFFLMSVAITGIGLIGEYVGRAYQAVSQHPRFVIREILEKKKQ